MQTKYEQITELRETATLINQMEFKIQFNSNSIEQLTKYNSHKENTDLINELTAITEELRNTRHPKKVLLNTLNFLLRMADITRHGRIEVMQKYF